MFFRFFAEFFRELKSQIITLNQIIRTREFWIYVGLLLALLAIGLAAIWVAAGFDPLTRGQLGMNLSCRTGQGQLATIIVGIFVFGLACLFTIGEVINWVEGVRESRAPGRQPYEGSYWRPLLHVLGTVVLGLGGLALMRTWCS